MKCETSWFVFFSGNDDLGVRGLEERHGGSGFSLEESGVGTVGALVSVVSFVLATETSDAGVRDAVSAKNHYARLHKSHAIFFLDCRLMAARVTARLFLFGRLEIDKQAVGCGQVDGILVVASGELVLEVGPKCAKPTTVGSLQEAKARVRSRAILRRCVVVSVSDETVVESRGVNLGLRQWRRHGAPGPRRENGNARDTRKKKSSLRRLECRRSRRCARRRGKGRCNADPQNDT